jgi:AcrR family transcriptional regulator
MQILGFSTMRAEGANYWTVSRYRVHFTNRLSVCQGSMSARVDKAASTRAKIIAVGRRLFATRGYEDTSIEAILEETQMSRGALYHHFENKEALFAAVMEAVEADVTIATSPGPNVAGPLEALQHGFETFVDLACEAEVRQIILTDAHSVLGWEKWREIEERYGLGRIRQALKFLADAGRIDEGLIDIFAHVLLASLLEIAFVVARSPKPSAAAETGRKAIKELLERVLGAR